MSLQVCLPVPSRAKCEWPAWAVNHPRPGLLTVSHDGDDDVDDDWMMMMMMMRLRIMMMKMFLIVMPQRALQYTYYLPF